MNAGEGLRRITRVISALAWLWLSAFAIGAVAVLFGQEPGMSIVMGGCGGIGFALFQAVAWVLSGFVSKDPAEDGLLRAKDIFSIFRRKNRATNKATIPTTNEPSWKGRVVWGVAFVLAFVAVKTMRQSWSDREALVQGAAKADQSMRDTQAQAANAHPEMPLGEAMRLAGAEKSESALSKASSDTQKADEAAGQFLGYYLVNVRARSDYCKAQGVDISSFVEAFRRHNAQLYAKSRVIHARGPYSADKLEEMLYDQMRPSLERIIQDSTTDFATRNNMSVADVCQGIADAPDDTAQQLELSRLNPALYKAMTDAQ